MSGFSDGRMAIGICGRCGMTKNYKELIEDGNIKGLYVCGDTAGSSDGCYDALDPYKLAPRPPDSFILHHPRPDAPLSDVPPYIITNPVDAPIDTNSGSPFFT